MIAGFLVFLTWAGGGVTEYFAKKQPAVTWFRNVGGLKEKVQVVYQGFPIGTVDKIAYDSEKGLIKVTMILKGDFPMPKKGIATITSASLLGDMYIEILGTYDPSMRQMLIRGDDRILDDNGTLVLDGIDPQSLGMLQLKLGMMLEGVDQHIDTLSDSLGRVLTGAEALMGNANMLIGDPAFRSDIHATATNLRVASGELPGTLGMARDMMASASSAAGRVDRLIARSEDTVVSMVSNLEEMTLNAKVLTYGLTAKPSMLVWGDKAWEARVARRDPELISASLRSPAPATTAVPASTEAAAPRRREGSTYFKTERATSPAPDASAPASEPAPTNETAAPPPSRRSGTLYYKR